jgi:hypothetical protein
MRRTAHNDPRITRRRNTFHCVLVMHGNPYSTLKRRQEKASAAPWSQALQPLHPSRVIVTPPAGYALVWCKTIGHQRIEIVTRALVQHRFYPGTLLTVLYLLISHGIRPMLFCQAFQIVPEISRITAREEERDKCTRLLPISRCVHQINRVIRSAWSRPLACQRVENLGDCFR